MAAGHLGRAHGGYYAADLRSAGRAGGWNLVKFSMGLITQPGPHVPCARSTLHLTDASRYRSAVRRDQLDIADGP